MPETSTPVAQRSHTQSPSILVRLLPLLVFASGASALIYESLWMRSFGIIFGNTTYAVSVILATFMGGMAIGSFLTARLKLRRILHRYALVEFGIAGTALLSFFLLKGLPVWYAFLVGDRPSPALEVLLRVCFAALIILPTTFCAGMTFPLLVEFLTRRTHDLRANLSFLYFVNTLGGAVGTFLCVFLLLPAIGVFGTTVTAIALNLSAGAAAWLLGNGVREEGPVAAAPVPSPTVPPAPLLPSGPVPAPGTADAAHVRPRLHWLFLTLAFASGLISFGLETLWTRSYALIIGSSVYAFNLMLLSVLLGIIIGTFIYERIFPRIRRSSLWIAVILLSMGVLILLSVWVIGWLPMIYFMAMKAVPVSFGAYQAIGFGLCFFTMLPVTVLFGFLFPLLTHQVKETGHSAQEISGKLYGWNTLGAIGGALLTGFVFIPLSGIQTPYVWMAGTALLLGWVMLTRSLSWQIPFKAGGFAVLLILIALLGVWYRPWNLLMMTSGIYQYGVEWRETNAKAGSLLDGLKKIREVLYYVEGRECTVSVTRGGAEHFLAVNGKIDAGTNPGDIITQKMIAHVPLMLHPDPKTALVIGWGSGCTSGTAGMYPSLGSIECAEIEPACYDARSYFTALNHNIDQDPRFQIIFKDGRNHLLASKKSYDIIMSEPSNPWVSGVNNLFTADCYRIVLSHLADDGIFCQWFHYYNMSIEDIRVQIRTFLSVFPETSCWVIPPTLTGQGTNKLTGDILLIGSPKPQVLDYRRVEKMFKIPAIRDDMASTRVILSPLSFTTNLTLLRDGMTEFAGTGPLNTDDSPWIEIHAPKGLYFTSRTESQQRGVTIFTSLGKCSTFSTPPMVNFPPLAKGAPIRSRINALVDLGGIYQIRSMFNKAVAVLEEALRLDPVHVQAHTTLGEVLCIMGDDVQGEKHCLRAIQLDPSLKRPYEVLGTVYINRRDHEKARKMYQYLMKRYPSDSLPYYGMAVILAGEGSLIAARDYASKAYGLNPQSEMIQKLYRQLMQAMNK